jgi:hypothetical protein
MLCVFWSVFFKLTLLIKPQTPGLLKRAFPRAIFCNGVAGWIGTATIEQGAA